MDSTSSSHAAADPKARRTFLERLGAWAFSQRSWTPVPLALILVLIRWKSVHEPWVLGLGFLIVLAGLGIRYWAVSYIGTISRTRAERYGPLMSAGPFALVRNPLYVGNFLIWIGFVVSSGLIWMLPVAWALFALQYTAIVRFEEAALVRHFGTSYDTYLREVPRWTLDLGRFGIALRTRGTHGWHEVCFSERGTLIAAGVMAVLLIAKYRWSI
jgi:protein-S-isoprenylcysteine O-methyltransferase Ste14